MQKDSQSFSIMQEGSGQLLPSKFYHHCFRRGISPFLDGCCLLFQGYKKKKRKRKRKMKENFHPPIFSFVCGWVRACVRALFALLKEKPEFKTRFQEKQFYNTFQPSENFSSFVNARWRRVGRMGKKGRHIYLKIIIKKFSNSHNF